MARPLRRVQKDGFYHVLNRGNGGMTLFRKPGDFEAFAPAGTADPSGTRGPGRSEVVGDGDAACQPLADGAP